MILIQAIFLYHCWDIYYVRIFSNVTFLIHAFKTAAPISLIYKSLMNVWLFFGMAEKPTSCTEIKNLTSLVKLCCGFFMLLHFNIKAYIKSFEVPPILKKMKLYFLALTLSLNLERYYKPASSLSLVIEGSKQNCNNRS